MRHIILESYRDYHIGELGLIVRGTPKNDGTYADRFGGLVAHDIVEHQNGVDKIGCPADELEALGAIWQVRGRHGFPDSRGIWSPQKMLAEDIETVVNDLDGAGWWPEAGRYWSPPHDYDEDFEAVLEEAAPNIMRDQGEDFPLDAFLDNALNLMRIGFRKAARRWGMEYNGFNTYQAIKRAVGVVIPQLQVEGQTFRLSYGGGDARCKEIGQ